MHVTDYKTSDRQQLTLGATDLPPIMACIDRPTATEFVLPNPRICRFVGWAASTQNQPVSIKVRIGDGPVKEFAANKPRPDVVDAMQSLYKISDPNCGFEFDLVLPSSQTGGWSVSLEFTDGQYITCHTFSLRRSHAPRKDLSSGKKQRRLKRFLSIFRLKNWPSSQAGGNVDGSSTPRSAYKEVWNSVSAQMDTAKISVAGYVDEDKFESTGNETVKALEQTVGISPDDVILEIGCGVGRVGKVLANRCRKWIGTDVAENMLQHARVRLRQFDNVELVATSGWDLEAVPSASADVVYCTVVFMHLDEWERFNYIQEAFRVLKPGGRIYVDNFNLMGDMGWNFFMEHLRNYHPLERPAIISKSSTPQELSTYLSRAEFTNIEVRSDTMWVYAWAKKPA